MTAKAPMTPPRGAHHGIAPMPSTVGKGRGRQNHKTPRRAITGRKETRLASQGLVSEFFKTPFIGGTPGLQGPGDEDDRIEPGAADTLHARSPW
jgi:hypothetical protein